MDSIIRCFLIEDDMDDQEIFSMALGDIDKKIELTIANDGAEALEMLQAPGVVAPHYIFIDVNMPRMNGLVCLKEIKLLPHIESSDVFMFSTTSDQKLIDICLELGAREFIVKPAALKALSEKLRNVIARNSNNNK